MIQLNDAREKMFLVYGQRRREKTLDERKDELHTINVARYARILAEGIARKEKLECKITSIGDIAEFAGYMHHIADSKRKHNGIESARWVAYTSSHINKAGKSWIIQPRTFTLQREELAAVAFALIERERDINTLVKMCGKNMDEKAIAALSLKFADDLLEAYGFRMIENACFFSGNRRVNWGDLQFLNREKRTRENPAFWAVLGDTMQSIYSRKPSSAYPVWLRSAVSRMSAIEYRFYANLIRMGREYGYGDELKSAKMLAESGYPKFDSEFVDLVRRQRRFSRYPERYEELGEAVVASKIDDPYMLSKIIADVSTVRTSIEAYVIWKDHSSENYFAHGIVDYSEGVVDYADRIITEYKAKKKIEE